MDLGPLGEASSQLSVHRGIGNCLLSISNWIFFCAAVLLYKSNPARFMVLMMTVAASLAWMLVINRVDTNNVYRVYYQFFANTALFWLAFSILLLPLLKGFRPICLLGVILCLLGGVLGMHLLIYGVFWYFLRSILLMIIPIAAFLIACMLTIKISRKNVSPVKAIVVFILSNLLSILFTLAVAVGLLYAHQVLSAYEIHFDFYAYYYYLASSFSYVVIFYALLTPFAFFMFKNNDYRATLTAMHYLHDEQQSHAGNSLHQQLAKP